jgi:hypothetical protein
MRHAASDQRHMPGPLESARGDGWGSAFHPDNLGKVREKWRELVELGVSKEIEASLLNIRVINSLRGLY